jgi:hypothetical protein
MCEKMLGLMVDCIKIYWYRWSFTADIQLNDMTSLNNPLNILDMLCRKLCINSLGGCNA